MDTLSDVERDGLEVGITSMMRALPHRAIISTTLLPHYNFTTYFLFVISHLALRVGVNAQFVEKENTRSKYQRIMIENLHIST